MREKPACELVKAWREQKGLTQAELATDIGDKSGQFQRWESGDRLTLPLRMRVRLALLSGIPLIRFVKEKDLRLARELVIVMARDSAA